MRVFVLFFSANIQRTSWNLCSCNLLQFVLVIGLFSTILISFLKLGIFVWKDSTYSDRYNRQEHFLLQKIRVLVHCTCLCIACEQPNWQMVILFDYLKNKAMWDYKRYVFIRCRTEYEVKDQAAKGDEVTRKRFHAFVLFLGELYLNLEVRRNFSF